MWKITDIGLPTYEDEHEIFGDQSALETRARLRAWGVRTGAIKRGALGPLSIEILKDPNTYSPVNHVVDSTAVGDSFNGAFLATWAKGNTIIEAMNDGHTQAGKVLTHSGAFKRV